MWISKIKGNIAKFESCCKLYFNKFPNSFSFEKTFSKFASFLFIPKRKIHHFEMDQL